MSQNIASFLKRVGALIPGFQGYESSEELRESDYQIRLYTKEALENYIYLIERAKGELDDKELMNLDKIQSFLDQKTIDLKDTINTDLLKKLKLINKNSQMLKILGTGEIKDKINIEADLISKAAMEKLEKAGGKIQLKK